MSLASELRQYVTREFLTADETAQLSDTADLFEILDSLEIVRLVAHLEGHYGILVNDDEISAMHLGSLESLTTFVGRKRGAGSAVAAS